MTLSEQQTTQVTDADLDVITIVINDQSHQVASESNLHAWQGEVAGDQALLDVPAHDVTTELLAEGQ